MSLLTLLVLFVRFDNVLVDLSHDMAGDWCEWLPVVWQVPFQLSPFEPTSFGSLPEILGWIQEVSQPRQQKKLLKNLFLTWIPTRNSSRLLSTTFGWSVSAPDHNVTSQFQVNTQFNHNVTQTSLSPSSISKLLFQTSLMTSCYAGSSPSNLCNYLFSSSHQRKSANKPFFGRLLVHYVHLGRHVHNVHLGQLVHLAHHVELAQPQLLSQTDAFPPVGSYLAVHLAEKSSLWWWCRSGIEDTLILIRKSDYYRLSLVKFCLQFWMADSFHHKRHRCLNNMKGQESRLKIVLKENMTASVQTQLLRNMKKQKQKEMQDLFLGPSFPYSKDGGRGAQNLADLQSLMIYGIYRQHRISQETYE